MASAHLEGGIGSLLFPMMGREKSKMAYLVYLMVMERRAAPPQSP
ncbi:hypothetical protein L288_00185 [Sphingobium quisquiliarum P25]|uniref:Uncharacterized protein n=1 Tax=Sphingobium quisquiliarum P25 TaxID=1329909 RepID=T0J0S0_9SPHN|nr:hypothetical protein L288_00185 [Sphingobium quisquiliarum P25]